MASTHIEITGQASRGSAQLRSNIDRLQDYMDDLKRLKIIVDAISSGGDWASLATYLGVDATQAEVIYNLLVGMHTDLVGLGSISQYLSRLG